MPRENQKLLILPSIYLSLEISTLQMVHFPFKNASVYRYYANKSVGG